MKKESATHIPQLTGVKTVYDAMAQSLEKGGKVTLREVGPFMRSIPLTNILGYHSLRVSPLIYIYILACSHF